MITIPGCKSTLPGFVGPGRVNPERMTGFGALTKHTMFLRAYRMLVFAPVECSYMIPVFSGDSLP